MVHAVNGGDGSAYILKAVGGIWKIVSCSREGFN